MATTPMTMVDAIAVSGARDAQANTGTVRFGPVVSVNATLGFVTVTVGGIDMDLNYLAGIYLSPGDWVAIYNERDIWFVLGKVIPSDVDNPAVGWQRNHIYLGDYGTTGAFQFINRRDLGAEGDYHVSWYATAYDSNGGGCDISVDGVIKARWTLGVGGQLNCVGYDAGGVATYRPSPFATQCGEVDLIFSNASAKQTTVNLATRRFTYRPMVVCCIAGASSYYSYTSTADIDSFAAAAYHRDATATTATVTSQWHAIQMLATSGVGGREAEPPRRLLDGRGVPYDVDVVPTVCHTPGCENRGVTVMSTVYTNAEQPVPDVVCGPCAQPIDFTWEGHR